MTNDWLQYPTVRSRIKRATGVAQPQVVPPKPTMLVAPERVGPAGATGWNPSTGFRDNQNAQSFLERSVGSAAPAAIQAAGRDAAGQSKLPWLTGLGVSTAVGAPVYKAVAQGISKLPLPGYAKLLGPVAAAVGSGVAAGVPAGVATQKATDYVYKRNPQGFNAQGITQLRGPASQLAASATNVQYNPFQQILTQLQQNPNARNALLGLLGGGLGGAALGGVAGHPWIGALLGLLGGGFVGGTHPQWGTNAWNSVYNTAWNQADKLNNRVVEAPAQ
jgi:hypothetical protein